MSGEGVRHPTMPIQGKSFVLIKPKFSKIGSKNMILALAFEALHAWEGFKVWLFNECGPNLCFPKALNKVLDFHNENPMTCHLTFAAEIRHHLP